MNNVAYDAHWKKYYEDKSKSREIMQSIFELYSTDESNEIKAKRALGARLITLEEFRLLREFGFSYA